MAKAKKTKFPESETNIFVCSKCGSRKEICIGELGSQLCSKCMNQMNVENQKNYEKPFEDDLGGAK